MKTLHEQISEFKQKISDLQEEISSNENFKSKYNTLH